MIKIIFLSSLILLAACSGPRIHTAAQGHKPSFKLQISKGPNTADPRVVFLLKNEYFEPVRNHLIIFKLIGSNRQARCNSDENGQCAFDLINQFDIGSSTSASPGPYRFKVSVTENSGGSKVFNYEVSGISFIPRVFEVTDETARIFNGPNRNDATKKLATRGQFFQINPKVRSGNYVNVCSGYGAVWLNASSGQFAYAMPIKENICH